ncbi:MAG: hypothetical protein K6356_13720 [Chloroflexus sp.]
MIALLYQTSTRRIALQWRYLALFVIVGVLLSGWPTLLKAADEPVTDLAALICTDALVDTALSRSPTTSPWRTVRDQVIFTTDNAHVFSPPQAIILSEDDDGDGDGSVDVDAFAQTFIVPPSTQQMIGSLRYRIAPGALGMNDSVTLSLNMPDDPTPSGRVFTVDLPLSRRADGNWRSFTWAATEGLEALVARGAAQLVITMRGVNDDAAIRISFDDIEVQVCGRVTATLSGRVTQRNRAAPNLSDAQVLLLRYNGSDRRVVATAQVSATDDGFRYQFEVPPLATGAVYQVWFANQPLAVGRDEHRLGVLAGPVVTALAAGQEITNLDLELSTVRLLTPPPAALQVLNEETPVRFSIEPRGIEGETYQICLYDPAVIDSVTGVPPQVCSPTLSATAPFFDLVPANFTTMPLRYGYPYRWYAVVHNNHGTAAYPAFGYSFTEHTITFVPAPSELPIQPVSDEGSPPGSASAAWTVLIYVAADNALGDPTRLSLVAQPEVELERLRTLAVNYPTISIVTWIDGYGNTGGRLCALRGNAVDCRHQPEANSADPATLSAFLEYGLTRFPAAHTMLVLVGPAHPAFGFGSDESVLNTPTMSMPALGTALTNATTVAGRRIDLVLMQAPLTANLTTATALAPAANYLVAPPGQIWRIAWLHRVLDRLVATDGDNPRAVAADLPTIYAAAVRADGVSRGYALAAFDLSQANAVRSARDALAAELTIILAERNTVIQALLAEVRAASFIYDTSGNGLADMMLDLAGNRYSAPEDAFVDLGDFTAALAAAPALQAEDLTAARAATTALAAAMGGSSPFVIATRRLADGQIGIPSLPPGAGLAEFFPHRSLLGGQPLLVEYLLYRGQTDSWSTFLRRYLAADRPFGIGGVTAVPAGGSGLPLIVGKPIAYERYLPIVSLADRR